MFHPSNVQLLVDFALRQLQEQIPQPNDDELHDQKNRLHASGKQIRDLMLRPSPQSAFATVDDRSKPQVKKKTGNIDEVSRSEGNCLREAIQQGCLMDGRPNVGALTEETRREAPTASSQTKPLAIRV